MMLRHKILLFSEREPFLYHSLLLSNSSDKIFVEFQPSRLFFVPRMYLYVMDTNGLMRWS
jgi:hypothetical protein